MIVLQLMESLGEAAIYGSFVVVYHSLNNSGELDEGE
jgi:hypothetical protein